MTLMRMNQKTYAEHWEKESSQFESKGIYKRLSAITPKQDTLEIGCGIGVTTQHLALTRKVLSIDNNEHIIKKALTALEGKNLDVSIINADIFELSPQSISTIEQFAPKGIVAWFIGSHPDDVDKRTPLTTTPLEKPKKYRENIEDLLLSVSPSSVEWIHLANRCAVNEGATESEIVKSTKDDYDTYLFSSGEFKVVDVQIIDWNTAGSNFMYVQAPNPNADPGRPVPKVISILARRVKAAGMENR